MLYLFSSTPTTQHCLVFSIVSPWNTATPYVHAHTRVCETEREFVNTQNNFGASWPSPANLTADTVPLTFRKPMSEWWWKCYQYLHFTGDCTVGSALSLDTRQPMKTNASSHGKSSWDVRGPNHKKQSSGESRLWYFCHSQTTCSQNCPTELSSGGNNSAWSPHVLLPGWSPSDRWRAWTLRCFGQLEVLWLTWQFWSLRWAGSWRNHLHQTPRWGQAMLHRPRSSAPRKEALQRQKGGTEVCFRGRESHVHYVPDLSARSEMSLLISTSFPCCSTGCTVTLLHVPRQGSHRLSRTTLGTAGDSAIHLDASDQFCWPSQVETACGGCPGYKRRVPVWV